MLRDQAHPLASPRQFWQDNELFVQLHLRFLLTFSSLLRARRSRVPARMALVGRAAVQ